MHCTKYLKPFISVPRREVVHIVQNAYGRKESSTQCQSQNDTSTSTMEALVYNAKDNSLSFVKDQAAPKITNDTDVTVKVAYSGICGTDLHIIKGEFPAKSDEPFILGHEFSGTVHEVGNTSIFKPGQNVVVDPNRSCGLCNPCRIGKYQYCKTDKKSNVGVFRDGGWAQYVTVPQDQVFLLPESVTLAQGALCEPYSCVSHGFDLIGALNVGQKILIIGAGIIGNLFITTLHHQGHRNVTVAELNESRLKLVENLDTGYKLVKPDRLQANGTNLFDVIVDCTGVGQVLETSFPYLDDGGKYMVFGCASPAEQALINPFNVFDKELTLIGVKVNPFSFPKAIGWLSAMGDRYLDYKKLGIKTFKLSEYEDAIKSLKEGSIAKAVLTPNENNLESVPSKSKSKCPSFCQRKCQ